MAGPGPKELLAQLNGLKLGELSAVDGELTQAGRALAELGQSELSGHVDQARRSLRSGDIRGFRRSLATVTARLGHLK